MGCSLETYTRPPVPTALTWTAGVRTSHKASTTL